MQNDTHFMRHALQLAARGLGRTWPNPSVGCVIMKNGRILAAARTADGGRPHAEKQAIATVGKDISGATAYVTLEPCAHEGESLSCAETLANSGVTRVVIACRDSDARTNGKGIALLREAGISVTENICGEEARKLNAGFLRRIETGMPLVSIKTATSLDGFIANSQGESQWITSTEARNHGHLLRANHDAIITGINTILTDNPALTCRVKGLESYSPVRVVLDSGLRFPCDCILAQTAKQVPVWIFTTSEDRQKIVDLESLGITVVVLPAHNGHVDAEAALKWLARKGITRVLAEGGAALNSHLLSYAQQLYLYRAPIILGKGKSAFEHSDTEKAPSDLTRFHRASVMVLGADMLEIYDLGE